MDFASGQCRRSQQSPQMSPAEDQNMIQAFAPKRSNQASRDSHSATASPVQWACRGYPWLAIGA
jgi:hypothetical protein